MLHKIIEMASSVFVIYTNESKVVPCWKYLQCFSRVDRHAVYCGTVDGMNSEDMKVFMFLSFALYICFCFLVFTLCPNA